jgi:hypothetical protein
LVEALLLRVFAHLAGRLEPESTTRNSPMCRISGLLRGDWVGYLRMLAGWLPMARRLNFSAWAE